MHGARLGLAACALALLGAVPAIAQSAGNAPSVEPVTQGTPREAAPAPTEPASPVANEPDKPFARFFPHLFTDLKKIATSKDSAITLGIGGALSLATHPADDYVTEHATARGTMPIFEVGGVVGDGYVQIGGALATYVIGRVSGHATTAHVGADLIRAHALSGLLTHAVKLSVQRDRPGRTSSGWPASYSFPSGHASSSWTSATVLWRHLGWKAGVPASFVALWVSGSRVQQNAHFLSDVAFGTAIGIASGRTITVGHTRDGSRLALAPTPVLGGAAVMFTLVRP